MESQLDRKTVQNINENLCDWEEKPRRKAYIQDRDHKAKCLTQYTLLDYQYTTNPKDKTFTCFNFKKTNAKKYKYSCGGYGGTCSSCKCNYCYHSKVRSKFMVETNGSGLNNFSLFYLKKGVILR